MLAIETVISFLLTVTLVILAPGPDNLFVFSQSVLHGKKAGIVAVLGICTGLIFHTTAIALGLAVLFQSSAIAFTILKTVGAIYLLYLAWKVLTTTVSVQTIEATATTYSLRKLYLQAMIINISNPKASMFFLAFLPQFVDTKIGAVEYQIIMLGGLAMLASFLIYGVMVLLTFKLKNWVRRSPWIQMILNKTIGVMFLGFAFKLATSHR